MSKPLSLHSYLFMIEKLKTTTQWTKFQGATNKYDNSDLWRDTTQQMLRRWMRITWLDVQLCLSNLLNSGIYSTLCSITWYHYNFKNITSFLY